MRVRAYTGVCAAFVVSLALAGAATGAPRPGPDDSYRSPPEQPENPMCEPGSDTECGWFWKRSLPEKDEDEEKPGPIEQPRRGEQAKRSADEDQIDCTDEDEWRATCGFVDPGTSYSFQAKQRDALREQMIMNPNTPKSVRGFQKYTNWMLNQAITAARMWKYNTAQDPSLDMTTDQPTSRFGLKLLQREKSATQQKIYQLIREEGGFFVYFSRSDCNYCHDLMPVLASLEEETGVAVHNASLDEQCMPGFDAEHCLTGEHSTRPAAMLKVRTVPDLLLYLPADNTWIRLATGVKTLSTIKTRIKLFVSGMKAAYENAVVNAENEYSPNMDFKHDADLEQRMGTAKGIEDDSQ